MQVKLLFFFFVTLYKYVQIYAGPFGTIPDPILNKYWTGNRAI